MLLISSEYTQPKALFLPKFEEEHWRSVLALLLALPA